MPQVPVDRVRAGFQALPDQPFWRLTIRFAVLSGIVVGAGPGRRDRGTNAPKVARVLSSVS
jgi:hypothetical protein